MDAMTARRLTDHERALISRILSVEFAGVMPLRTQLVNASVARSWQPAGSLSFDIQIPPDSEASPLPGRLAPVDARVTGPDGTYIGELLLWVENGRLSAFEYSWITDAPPEQLPEISKVTVSARAQMGPGTAE
jgi:hypothetical protein